MQRFFWMANLSLSVSVFPPVSSVNLMKVYPISIVHKNNRITNALLILFKICFQTLFYIIHNTWPLAIWLCFGLTNRVYDCQRYLVVTPWSALKRKYKALTTGRWDCIECQEYKQLSVTLLLILDVQIPFWT